MNINYAVAHKCQFAHGAEYKKFIFGCSGALRGTVIYSEVP